jgi:hypothetical protein
MQALVLLVVLLLFLSANQSKRPFAVRKLNDIEGMSLITQVITMYCGVFFLSDKPLDAEGFDPNKDFNLPEWGSFLFFMVISTCNIAFMIFWIKEYCH